MTVIISRKSSIDDYEEGYNEKIISVILSIAMLICACPVLAFDSYADKDFIETKGLKVSRDSIETIACAADVDTKIVTDIISKDIDTLRNCFVPIDFLCDVEYQNDKIIYLLDLSYSNLIARVSYEEDDAGNISIYITEGEENDVLLLMSNGLIYLNGSEVTFEERSSENCDKENKNEVTRARYSEYSKNDFFPGATYVQSGNPMYRVIDSGSTLIKDITITALSTLIAAAIGGIPGAVAEALFSVIAGQIKSKAAQYCPTTTAASCIIQKYTKSPQNDPLNLYYKYVGNFYANSNFTVYVGSSTYYECNYFA